jgi:hemerythrin-like domain-containing protein
MTTPPDLTHYFAIHNQMRIDTTRLVQVLEVTTVDDRARQEAVARYTAGFANELAHHHEVEDGIFFPALLERSPSVTDALAGLEADHRCLDGHLERLAGTVAAVGASRDTFAADRNAALELTTDLRDLLHPHLEIEDVDVLPRFYRHFDQAEYEVLFKKAAKQGSLSGVTFMAAWHITALDPADRPALMASAGLPLRLVYKASRRNFERLVATAFGDLPVAA